MATVAEVGVNLVARTGQFERGMMRAGKTLGTFRRAALAAVGLGSAVQAARSFAAIGDEIDRIGKLSTRLGVSTEALSQMRLVAAKSGVEFETLAKGMADGARKISEAAAGKGEAKTAFAQLGLDAANLARLSPETQIEEIADAFKVLDDNSLSIELSQRIFGESGSQFLQFLKGGAMGIRELRMEADALGTTLSEAGVREVEKFNDAATSAGAAVKGFFEQSFAGLAAMANRGYEAIFGGGKGAAVEAAAKGIMSGTFNFAEEQHQMNLKAAQLAEKRKADEQFLRGIYGQIVSSQPKAPTSIGMGQQISLRRTALHSATGISGGKPQMVKDPTLDVVVDVLRKILQKTGGATAS